MLVFPMSATLPLSSACQKAAVGSEVCIAKCRIELSHSPLLVSIAACQAI